MKYQALISLAVTVASAYQDVRKNFNGDKVVDIHVDHITEDVRAFFQKHEGDLLGVNEEEFHSVKISSESFESLKDEGFQFKDTTEKWIDHFQANFDNPELFCSEDPQACAGRNTQAFYSSYQNLDTINARIEALVESSDLATISQIGTSYEGRPINIVEIADDGSKPLAYFMCTIHAREWLTPLYCTYMIEMLIADGGHELLDTFAFAILSVGNPDGYEYSRNTYNLWRKTRDPNPGSSCVGTDPNRNYNHMFAGPGTSSNPCTDIYHGQFPFSTSEVATVDAYGAANADRLITWSDIHSYGGYWLSPLGYTRGLPPAVDYNRMAACMSDAVDAVFQTTGQRWRYGGAANLLGPAAGASDDYFYFIYDVIYSYTVEMRGPNFQPSTNNIAPAMRETYAGAIAQMQCIKQIEIDGDGTIETSPTPAPVCTSFFC